MQKSRLFPFPRWADFMLNWPKTVFRMLWFNVLLFHCSLCPLPPVPSLTPSTTSLTCPPPPPPPPSRLDSDCLSSPTRHSLSDGSEDQLDRLQQVELARMTPMSQWRAGTVQAWLEVVMAMPMYIRSCSENVKSGKVGLKHTHDAGALTFVHLS